MMPTPIRSGRLAGLFLGLCLSTSLLAAEADSDPKALAIAEASFEAMGGQKGWDATRYFRFNFFGFRLHHWDRQTGQHRLEGATREGVEYVVLHNLNSRQGVAYINGAKVAPGSGEYFETVNPYTSKIWGEVARCGAAEVDVLGGLIADDLAQDMKGQTAQILQKIDATLAQTFAPRDRIENCARVVRLRTHVRFEAGIRLILHPAIGVRHRNSVNRFTHCLDACARWARRNDSPTRVSSVCARRDRKRARTRYQVAPCRFHWRFLHVGEWRLTASRSPRSRPLAAATRRDIDCAMR